jgi:hypothetical protein
LHHFQLSIYLFKYLTPKANTMQLSGLLATQHSKSIWKRNDTLGLLGVSTQTKSTMNESQFNQKIKQEKKLHQRGRIVYPPIPIQPSPIDGIPNIPRKRRFGFRQVHLSRRRTFRSSSQPSSSRMPSIGYFVDDAIDKVGHRAHHSDSGDDLT